LQADGFTDCSSVRGIPDTCAPARFLDRTTEIFLQHGPTPLPATAAQSLAARLLFSYHDRRTADLVRRPARHDCTGIVMDESWGESVDLIERARRGEHDALNALFARHRDRLRRMVDIRLDPRLQARLDASDVVQDAYVKVTERLDEYFRQPKVPFFLWLRLVVGEQLTWLHRHHLGTGMRAAGRERSLSPASVPEASSAALAAQLVGRHTSPTQQLARAERVRRVREALNALDPVDREVLSLRHFEELTAAETAQVLGIEEAAAAKRFFRATKRLKAILGSSTGGAK
jgi:RNA polymerase sigma-70 factor (ECF subfamily)